MSIRSFKTYNQSSQPNKPEMGHFPHSDFSGCKNIEFVQNTPKIVYR